MALNLGDTETQRGDLSPIPPGVYCLRARLMAGNAGPDFLLRRAKNGVSLMLALECTVVDGEHQGRKIWDYISCELDDDATLTPLPQDKREKLQTSVRMGRSKMRAVIDSALNLDPNDTRPETQAKRNQVEYRSFDGIVFWAQIEERPASNGYKASNGIDFIVTPGDTAYPSRASGSATLPATSRAPKPKPLQDEMEDEIPF